MIQQLTIPRSRLSEGMPIGLTQANVAKHRKDHASWELRKRRSWREETSITCLVPICMSEGIPIGLTQADDIKANSGACSRECPNVPSGPHRNTITCIMPIGMSEGSKRAGALLLFTAILSAYVLLPPAYGQDKMLHGGVNTSEYIRPQSGPSLNRKDIQNKGDPFGGNNQSAPGSDEFDAPEAAFGSTQQAPPKPPFNLQAQDAGEETGFGNQQGQMAPPPQEPSQMSNQQMLPPPQQMGNPNDPDNSPQMSLAWDEWHRRVAENIFVRFDTLAKKAFAVSRPLACQAVYTVSRDHQITSIRMVQKSPNIVFNSMVIMVIKSMNGNPILEFPAGSRRPFVEKLGNFSVNFGMDGFKHTINDNERIQQQRMQQQRNMQQPQMMPQTQMQQMQQQMQMMGQPYR